MNKVTIIGNVTKDPVMQQTQSGISNCSFTLAVRRKFKNDNGDYESDFLNCVAWKGTADICGKYLKKGSKCAIGGSIQIRSYDDKNGAKRYITEIIVDDVEFINKSDKAPSIPKETAQTGNKKQKQDLKPVEDYGLPF